MKTEVLTDLIDSLSNELNLPRFSIGEGFKSEDKPAFETYIDHTVLKGNCRASDIDTLCEEAKTYAFKAVCVNPVWVRRASENLSGSNVNVCTVIGFPLGANTSEVKAFETSDAIKNGATEVDMVINISALKDKEYKTVFNDIKAVVLASKDRALNKVIFETCDLNEEEIAVAAILSRLAGADYIKTSTGFGSDGARAEHIRLMRLIAGSSMGVKASGGVRTKEKAIEMIQAGASRIGTSSSVKLVTE